MILCSVLLLGAIGNPVLAETEAPSGTPSALGAMLDAIESPKIIGEMDPPESLAIGRAEIRPSAGSRLLVFAVEGREAGYILEGEASLVYRVEDRFSIPPTLHNLKKTDGFDERESDGVLVMSTSLKGAAVWGWDIDLGESPVSSVEGRALPEWLVEALEEKYSPNPARDLLRSDLNGNPGYRWAFLRAKGEDLVLDVDPQPAALSESLVRLLPSRARGANPYSGKRFSEPVTTQPIGRAWWEPEAIEFVSTEIDIDVRNTDRNFVKVKTRTRLQSQRDGLRLLPMRNSIGTFDSDGGWHEYRILGLTVNGEPVDYVHRLGDLLIDLPQALNQGEALVLEAEAEGEILVRPSGDNYWRLGGDAWYPKPGPGGAEWAAIRTTAEVQAPYTVFAAGEVLESENGEETSRVRTQLKGPMGFAMVIAGKYRTVSEELDGARVHISSYAAVKEKEADRIAQVVLSVADCLGTWLGVPYPFQDLQVVEVNQWGWGQAPPGLIFITQEAFLTRASAQLGAETRTLASFFSRGINERMAHEVAHAWFPHVAKVVRGEENWLSESLSDYASAVCLQQKMSNKKKGRQLFDRQLQEWKNLSKEAKDATSVYLAHHLTSEADGGFIRQALLYGRGPLVLHAIRQRLQKKHGEEEGDRMFLTWLRSYIRNFTFKVAETRHLVAILNQVTGEDWQPFFERHIYGAEPPEVD